LPLGGADARITPFCGLVPRLPNGVHRVRTVRFPTRQYAVSARIPGAHRPYVGLRPTTPHQEAGCLTEPPVSVPRAPVTAPDATAAAEPPAGISKHRGETGTKDRHQPRDMSTGRHVSETPNRCDESRPPPRNIFPGTLCIWTGTAAAKTPPQLFSISSMTPAQEKIPR